MLREHDQQLQPLIEGAVSLLELPSNGAPNHPPGPSAYIPPTTSAYIPPCVLID